MHPSSGWVPKVSCAALVAAGLTFVQAEAQAQLWPELAEGAAVGGGEGDAAVIIAVGDYATVEDIPGAVDNARDWYAWLTRGRGVPTERVRLLQDNYGTVEKMRRGVEEAAGQVGQGGTLWVVFIGHGAPSEDGKDGVLVGYDAQQDPESLYARSLRQSELLALADQGQQTRTVLVLDACFSGKGGSGGALAKGLQPLIPVREQPAANDRNIVFSAGTSDQFAGPLPGASRPAFSYLVLGALRGWADRDRDAQLSAAEVHAYTLDALRTLVVGRTQTPELRAASPEAALLPSAGEEGPNLGDIAIAVSKSGEGEGPAVSTSRGPRKPAFFSGAHSLHLLGNFLAGYSAPDREFYSTSTSKSTPADAVLRTDLAASLLGVHGWVEWALAVGYSYSNDPNIDLEKRLNNFDNQKTASFSGFRFVADLGFPLFSWPSPQVFPDSWVTVSAGVFGEHFDDVGSGIYVADTAYLDCLWVGRMEGRYFLTNNEYQPAWQLGVSVGVQTGRDEVCH